MTRVLDAAVRWPLTALLAVLLGLLIGAYWDDAIDVANDYLRPVSRARVLAVERAGDSLLIRLAVTRLRAGCHLVGAYAYGSTPEGVRIPAAAARLDGRIPDDIPVGIEIDVGTWRVWPVAGARTMVVYVHHDCEGRLISTRLVEVPA